MIPAWRVSTTPDVSLVNNMLDDAIGTLRNKEQPLIHTDRGCHVRQEVA